MKWATLVVLLLTAVSALADEDKLTEEPAGLVQARKAYEARIKAVVDPIKAGYLKRLNGMKRIFAAKGDSASADAVQQEIDSLAGNAAPVALTVPAGPAALTAPAAPSPIVGNWARPPGDLIIFRGDGTVSSGVLTGKWTCLDKNARTYQISWSGGKGDWLWMSADGATVIGKNMEGFSWTGKRMPGP